MTLRDRVVLTLLAISLVLVAPAFYGVSTLRELRAIAQELRARNAVAALTLGRLQTAISEIDQWERAYVALAESGPEESADAQRLVEENLRRVKAELDRLTAAGYRAETATAQAEWAALSSATLQVQRLVEAGAFTDASAYRDQRVDPVIVALTEALDPIGTAINRVGGEAVRRAQEVADRATTTVVLALAVALAIALVLAGWLTQSLVRPIKELRRGMSVVAGGNLEPRVAIPVSRPDEIGDLARSFRRMTQQLTELDRLKAEFVSIASHELKTPLSVIRGYVSLLLDGIYGEIAEQQRPILRSVNDQTDRLTRLIQQLLDISRFEAGGGRLEMKPIDLQFFLSDLVTSFEALAIQNQIDFVLQASPKLPSRLVGDADRLNEVLGNLLSNAFKFTPRGGRILLRAGQRDQQIVVEVADTGVGIPSDQIPRIFEKFYQVENAAQPRSVGSGLGLAIASEIVEAHGGTISAESQVGRGTTFRVVLPLNNGDGMAGRTARAIKTP